MTYTCPVCSQPTPEGKIQYKLSRGTRKPKCCKPCNVKRMLEWKLKNREKWRASQRSHQKRRARRAVLYRKIVENKSSELSLDVARKMLAEAPPDLKTEAEMAAYFKGYIAGAKRRENEDGRFDRLKDLVHRIAAESKMANGMQYEDVLSAAYEGLLIFLRRNVHHKDEMHERKLAAKAIRWAIIDAKRAVGPIRRDGSWRNPIPESSLDMDDENSITETLQDSSGEERVTTDALDSFDIDTRSRVILDGVMKGMSWVEIGKIIGVSPSRAWQLASKVGRDFPQLEELLAASV